MAYATWEDYERHKSVTLTADQRTEVTAKLDDAATILNAVVSVDVSDDRQMDLLEMVSCNMVERAMQSGETAPIGVSNMSYTMGPFMQSATMANPSGDMYLTSSEKRWLGVGGTSIRSIRPVIGGPLPC